MKTATRSINRLKSVQAVRDFVQGMNRKTADAGKEGRPVAWCLVDGFNGVILNAMGIDCVFPENYATQCAAAEAAGPFLERSDAEGFPSHLCGYARNTLGYAAIMQEVGSIPPQAFGVGMPKPFVLLGSGQICDARFKWFQSMRQYFDVPLWMAESPLPSAGAKESLTEGVYERQVRGFVGEMRDLVAFLEKLTGRKMDWRRLDEEVDATIAMDSVFWELNDLRRARPCPMHSRDFWASMSLSTIHTTDATLAAGLYRKMLDEVKDRVAQGICGINVEEKFRLGFEGIPPWQNMEIFDKLAEWGWNFVTERLYHPPKPVDLSMYQDPTERLARYRFPRLGDLIDSALGPELAAESKDAIQRTGACNMIPGGYPRDYPISYAREYQCDGLFLHSMLSCRPNATPIYLYGTQVKEVWKVPSIIVEGDMIDANFFDPANMFEKARAFEGTMELYKDLRKSAGMEW